MAGDLWGWGSLWLGDLWDWGSLGLVWCVICCGLPGVDDSVLFTEYRIAVTNRLKSNIL